jgi:competence protein ComEA
VANRLLMWISGVVIAVTAVIALVMQLDLRAAPSISIVSPDEAGTIVVAIDGSVEKPGVYELPYGSRVHDLLDAAGGYLSTSDLSAINQAALLIDGQRLYVPSREATETAKVAASPAPLLLDINRASAKDLEQLPGIGAVKAEAIVAYRNQNGPFRSVDDLLMVQGITEGVMGEIRPFVMVAP